MVGLTKDSKNLLKIDVPSYDGKHKKIGKELYFVDYHKIFGGVLYTEHCK